MADPERGPDPIDEDAASGDRSDPERTREALDDGGDAPAAGSIEEREAIAADDDELFGRDDRGTG